MSYREQLEPLPPSAKFAYKTLLREEPLTQSDLIHKTWMNERTTRRALKKLEKEGHIYKEHCVKDGRKDLYYIQSD